MAEDVTNIRRDKPRLAVEFYDADTIGRQSGILGHLNIRDGREGLRKNGRELEGVRPEKRNYNANTPVDEVAS